MRVLLLLVLTMVLPQLVLAAKRPKGQPARYRVACEALLKPNLNVARLLPKVSDTEALLLLNANYPELMIWLSQKADATAEGHAKGSIGNFGVDGQQSPSKLLFGRDIVEIDRTSVGFLALKWILAGDYESFTRNQPPPVKLSVESFQKLRNQVKALLKKPADVDAMIVMILTNDLGKVKRYHQLTERAVSRAIVDHDEVLFVGFSEWPEISPSFRRLDAKFHRWILDGLHLGSQLNIGQFAQAENLPANLSRVQALAGQPQAFSFKFIELLLDVAGAQGHMDSRGAKVMIEPVFRNFMTAESALHKVIEGESLRNAYDLVLTAKNKQLTQDGFTSLSVEDRTERALLRLLGMRRTQNAEQAILLSEVFHSLPEDQKTLLVDELNVDGVNDGWGILPYYAPALIANSINGLKGIEDGEKQALAASLQSLAQVFLEIRGIVANRQGHGVVTVNLEPFAKFATSEEFKLDSTLMSKLRFDVFEVPGQPDQLGIQILD